MADKKISALTASSTPLAGTEVLPIVQSGATVKVAVSNLTAGRDVGTKNILSTDGGNVGGAGGFVGVAANAGNSAMGGIKGGLANSAGSEDQGDLYLQTRPTGGAGQALRTVFIAGVDGNVAVPIGNLLFQTSGKGIDFSATPGTGTSELLADYEEGTWTPGFAAWTTAPTINASYCRYTKVGRQVTILMLCQNGVCGSTGQPITGLPFTSNSVSVASFRDASGAASTTFGIVDIGTQITSITAVNFTGLFWGMSATYFV